MRRGKRYLALLLAASMIMPSAVPAAAYEADIFAEENDFQDLTGDGDIFIDDTDDDVWIDDEESWEEDIFTEDENSGASEWDADVSGEEADDSEFEFPDGESEEPSDEFVVPEASGTEAGEDQAESVMPEAEDIEEPLEMTGTLSEDASFVGAGFTDFPYEGTETAIEKFADALGKFTSDTSKLSQLAGFLERFGGVTSTISGVIGILQMVGIIEDPTAKQLANILSEITNMENKLDDMDGKLDEITNKLIDMQADDELTKRETKARDYLSYWGTFNSTYVDPLNTYINKYRTGFINDAIKAWWVKGKGRSEGLMIYRNTNDELTYSNIAYKDASAAFPAVADNGEAISKAESIGIPAEYMPDTASMAFDINTYSDTLKSAVASKIVEAANAHALLADNSWYEEWGLMDELFKNATAAVYADGAVSSIVYTVSCDTMTENNLWVADVISAYNDYCSYLLTRETGVDAMLQVFYMSHGFEGEVSDSIKEFFDAMTVAVGYYGIFTMSVACQDAQQPTTEREKVRKVWIDTILKLDELKGKALTGYSNYCYLTKQLVTYEVRNLHSTMTSKVRKYTPLFKERWVFNGFDYTGWKVTDTDGNDSSIPGSIINEKYSIVLYAQYLGQKPKGSTETFYEYLQKNNVNSSSDGLSLIMTNYNGAKSFSLNDGLEMKAKTLYGDYFTSGKTYYINKGNAGKIEDEYFVVHDKVTGSYLDPGTGDAGGNYIFASRAAYIEHSDGWYVDEGHIFPNSASVNRSGYNDPNWTGGKYYTDDISFDVPVAILTQTDVPDNSIPEDSPAMNFDTGISYGWEENRPAVQTSIKGETVVLSATAYTYNGKVRRPSIRTIGGKKLAAGTDYTAIWENKDSKDPGTYKVTIIGKGEYVGSTTAEYTIRKRKNTLTVTRKKAEKAISYAKLSKGAQTVKRTEMYTVTKAQGTVSYKLVSVTKKAYAKYFKVDGKTGNITVGKGLPRGSCKLRLRTIAAGNDNYGKTSKLVVIRVVVR